MGDELAVINAVPPPPPSLAPPPGPPPTSLAPGFRFHPTDEELVQYYLKRKVCGKSFHFEAVSEIDVYKSEPWDLARHSRLKSRDQEWYFFSPVDRKYGNGARLNRATGNGYWKATGKDRSVGHKGKTIGLKKTLVFHGGRAPEGKRTNWVMHEYRLADEDLQKAGVPQNAFVLCRIFHKSGLGPPTASRYAPFIEEEWDNCALMVVPGEEAGDEMVNGDDAQFDGNEFEQDNTYSVLDAVPLNCDIPSSSRPIPFVSKRERSAEYPFPCTEFGEPIAWVQNKRTKRDDPNVAAQRNGSEESTTTTTHDLRTSATEATTDQPADVPSTVLELPLLLEAPEARANTPINPPTFDAADLEKSVPPGYLRFISNLEKEIINVSMEKESQKIELMRAQAMINVLHSRVGVLSKENEDLRKVIRDGLAVLR